MIRLAILFIVYCLPATGRCLFLFTFFGGLGVLVLDAELGLDGGGDGVLVNYDIDGFIADESLAAEEVAAELTVI